jgi:hypothetical protein
MYACLASDSKWNTRRHDALVRAATEKFDSLPVPLAAIRGRVHSARFDESNLRKDWLSFPKEACMGPAERTMQGDLASLRMRKYAELRALWAEAGLPGQPRLCRRILAALIAYKQQERAVGGLSPSVARQLREIAGETGRSPNVSRFAHTRIKPGTRLQCEWHGELHEVTVLESQFAYRGKPYPSLSAIARLITGVRWSGPAFFGLTRGTRRTTERARGQ